MRIYVDFDDCLCETGRTFSKLALEIHYCSRTPEFEVYLEEHTPEITIREEGIAAEEMDDC